MSRALAPGEALERARDAVSRMSQMVALGSPKVSPEMLAEARRRLALLEGEDTGLIEAQQRASAGVMAADQPKKRGFGGSVADTLAKVPAAVAAVVEKMIRPARDRMQEKDVSPLLNARPGFPWNDYLRHCREVIKQALDKGLHRGESRDLDGRRSERVARFFGR